MGSQREPVHAGPLSPEDKRLREALRALAKVLGEHHQAVDSLRCLVRKALLTLKPGRRPISRCELEAALNDNRGNVTLTAAKLKTQNSRIRRLMDRYGLRRTDHTDAPRTILRPELEAAIEANHGNISRTARGLRVRLAEVLRLMRRYDLVRADYVDTRPILRPELEAALRASCGNISHAARGLKVQRRQLQRLVTRYGLLRADYVNAPETSGPRIPETQ